MASTSVADAPVDAQIERAAASAPVRSSALSRVAGSFNTRSRPALSVAAKTADMVPPTSASPTTRPQTSAACRTRSSRSDMSVIVPRPHINIALAGPARPMTCGWATSHPCCCRDCSLSRRTWRWPRANRGWTAWCQVSAAQLLTSSTGWLLRTTSRTSACNRPGALPLHRIRRPRMAESAGTAERNRRRPRPGVE